MRKPTVAVVCGGWLLPEISAGVGGEGEGEVHFRHDDEFVLLFVHR